MSYEFGHNYCNVLYKNRYYTNCIWKFLHQYYVQNDRANSSDKFVIPPVQCFFFYSPNYLGSANTYMFNCNIIFSSTYHAMVGCRQMYLKLSFFFVYTEFIKI